MDNNWVKVKSMCSECGREIESRPDYLKWNGLIVRGWEPMQYRHADGYDGHKVSVYTDCNQYRDWMDTKGA